MNPYVLALVLGLVLLIVAWAVPSLPPTLRTVCNALGLAFALIGGLLLLLSLVGVV